MSPKLYASPLRVYFFLGALAIAGIFCGLTLPVSLFPNSSKPVVNVEIPYGSSSPTEFLNNHGKSLEMELRKISTPGIEVEKLYANYNRNDVNYEVEFKWGTLPNAALKEVSSVVNSFSSRLSQESRDGIQTNIWNRNSGFFAVSYFSETRTLDSLYDLLYPMLEPRFNEVKEAAAPELYNPTKKEVRIELNPDAMASFQILPKDIDQAVRSVLEGYAGGSVTTGSKRFHIEMPRQSITANEISQALVPNPKGTTVHLGDIAKVDLSSRTSESRSFKTNGAPSLILFAQPKPGGNVKKMSEDLLKIVKDIQPQLPKDVQYRVLVDPSEFIRAAINNVFHEVILAALLAVIVLFFFIGSFRNVVTAAIEIPMSMVLAFILMKWTGINLNLISLGGLALSAGMNVDGSVVVMENIFRHFEMNPGPHTFSARLRILVDAVKEVQFAVIASTISSLVVFMPLAFTSELSFAILGDLALAVVFSHGFSALVALTLVPTIRLQLMSSEKGKIKHSPFEGFIRGMERTYASMLNRFLGAPVLRWSAYASVALLLVGLTYFVLPRLPREIVGIPDTDWMTLNIRAEGNTLHRQMEQQMEEVEREYLKVFGDKTAYTFSQVEHPNSAHVMARLKSKKDMKQVWTEMDKRFVDTPWLKFRVQPWNPSELPIPDPPHVQIAIRGSDSLERNRVARELSDLIQEKRIYPRVWSNPNVESDRGIHIEPHIEQWSGLTDRALRFRPADLADLVRVATSGRRIAYLPVGRDLVPIRMKFPTNYITSAEDISSMPVGVNDKIVPFKALAKVSLKRTVPTIYRENEQELTQVEARLGKGESANTAAALARTKELVEQWKSTQANANADNPVTVTFEDPNKDLSQAIHQLSFAVGLSVLLIFFTMLIQFGSIAEPLLVLVSVPLGFIGVLLSLSIFGSTLSLNSILGVILLNGIAVANSIILVDFTKRRIESGLGPVEAAVDAAQKRLRPILITSATTILGMLPIAIGMGEGGRILQPLGIAVSGGLWVSTAFTLFLVPALHVAYLKWRVSRKPALETRPVILATQEELYEE